MPKDRKQTFSDRQSQAARDKKQPKKNTPPEDSSQAAGKIDSASRVPTGGKKKAKE